MDGTPFNSRMCQSFQHFVYPFWSFGSAASLCPRADRGAAFVGISPQSDPPTESLANSLFHQLNGVNACSRMCILEHPSNAWYVGSFKTEKICRVYLLNAVNVK